MDQLTIRGFEPDLEEKIRELARAEGISLNQAVLRLLRKGACIERSGRRTGIGIELDDLAGTWTAEEEREFLEAVKPFDVIDEEFWR